jgi:putative membrane protein|tara:strand:- start:369 stop:608 length:240 start_codon:yes stop_codon:yes gene_type:complete
MYFSSFILFALLVIAFVFGIQNDQTITLNYIVARIDISVAAAVSIFTVIGFIMGLLSTIIWRIIRKSKKVLKQKKSIES